MSAGHDTLTIRIVRKFLESHLSIFFIIVSLLLGVLALAVTPREEEPQLTVAAANVLVSFPGRTAQDVEQLVTTPLERMLFQVPGVEYVYSRSMPGQSMVTVKFYVGQPLEPSYVKLIRKLNENMDRTVPGTAGWIVKPIDVDDVPVVTFTLTSGVRDDYALRRMADEVVTRLQGTDSAGVAYVVGGRPRELLVRPSAARMAAYRITAIDLSRAIQASNSSLVAGTFDRSDRAVRVQAGQFISGSRDLQDLVIGVWNGRPVYLRDVADVTDGPGEHLDYVRFHRGPAWDHPKEAGAAGSLVGATAGDPVPPEYGSQPAVTVAIAKQRGSNNVRVAEDLLARMEALKREILPADVQVVATRNYGVTANAKVDELEEGMLIAVAVVMGLLAIGLGYRQAFVVALVVPCVFGLTLIVNYFFGFSVNRISLFALTVALGLLVDDPIVDVENIHRHFLKSGTSTADVVVEAVNEVRPPLISATFAVIFSFLPLLFITGMMGEYLRPMAANVPVTMFMSLLVSFTITPWLAYKLLKGHGVGDASTPHDDSSSTTRRLFSRTLLPLLDRPVRGAVFLLVVVVLFMGSILLVVTRQVPVKSLAYDNKDEMLLVLDMPLGTTLERTDAAARQFEHYLASVPEVTDFEVYVGTASPVDFNGLLRGYALRRGTNRADIRINLIHRTERAYASHPFALRLRQDLTAIAERNGVKMKLVELPAGPPVMSTVVATIYGSATSAYEDLTAAASIVKARMNREPGVVDVDDSVDEDQVRYTFEVDRQKAALNGVSTDDVARTLAVALGSQAVGAAQIPHERTPVKISLWFPRSERSSTTDLGRIHVRGAGGKLVPLSELGGWRAGIEDKTIHHRQLQRVAYVMGEMAGRPPVETILDMRADQVHGRPRPFVDLESQPRPLRSRSMVSQGGGIPWQVPDGVTVRWWDEGEMFITLRMFRDLGFALLGALILIYVILMNQTGSYGLPLTIMLSIPLMVIGVMPGFWLLNQFGQRQIGEFMNPVFFSGPAFMGMIALAGIVTRNSIIIVDFIHIGLLQGASLKDAILESVSVRLRPIVLVSGAAALGALPITRDSVFGGMAWALISGLIVSAVFSLFVIPVTYYLVYRNKADQGLPEHIRAKLAAARRTEVVAS